MTTSIDELKNDAAKTHSDEDIVAGVFICANEAIAGADCDKCPYCDDGGASSRGCVNTLLMDVIDLLRKTHPDLCNKTMRYMLQVGDVVKVKDCHHFEPHFYEVDSISEDSFRSQPADYRHKFEDIIAIYRPTNGPGNGLELIWEVKND
jgi:hypothetical protein